MQLPPQPYRPRGSGPQYPALCAAAALGASSVLALHLWLLARLCSPRIRRHLATGSVQAGEIISTGDTLVFAAPHVSADEDYSKYGLPITRD